MSVEFVYKIDGERVSKAEFRRRSRARRRGAYRPLLSSSGQSARGLGTTRRPKQRIVSEALACHPKDVAAFEADAKKRGFNIHFDSEGRPSFDSFSQRDRYAKSQGFHVRSSKKCPL